MAPVELVPIFIKVEELHKRLKEEESCHVFARSWNWVDAYLAVLHGEESEMYLFMRRTHGRPPHQLRSPHQATN